MNINMELKKHNRKYQIMSICYEAQVAENRLDINIDMWQNLKMDIWCKMRIVLTWMTRDGTSKQNKYIII